VVLVVLVVLLEQLELVAVQAVVEAVEAVHHKPVAEIVLITPRYVVLQVQEVLDTQQQLEAQELLVLLE
jgi:hypothetical protein